MNIYKPFLLKISIIIFLQLVFLYFHFITSWYHSSFIIFLSLISVTLIKEFNVNYKFTEKFLNYKSFIVVLLIFSGGFVTSLEFSKTSSISLILLIFTSLIIIYVNKFLVNIFYYICFIFFFVILTSVLVFFLPFDVGSAPHPSRISLIYTLFDFSILPRAKGIFWSPQYYSLIASIYLILLIFGKGFKNNFLKVISISLCIVSLYISETRTSIYSLFLVCSFLLLLYHFRRNLFFDEVIDRIALYVATIALSLMVALTLVSHFVKYNSFEPDDFSSGRISIWNETINKKSEDVSLDSINKWTSTDKKNFRVKIPHNHNLFLDLLNKFYNPVYIITITYLIFSLLYSLIKKDLFLFTFLSYVLIASQIDIIWRVDRLDIITVLLVAICLERKQTKIITTKLAS